ncbi:MAG: YggT family protein [Bacillota bacterium]
MFMLANAVGTLFTIVEWLIIARVILSWVRPNPSNINLRKVIRFVYQVTEPILGPIRRLLPTSNLGIDFSPIIAFFALRIVSNFIVRLLITF